MEVYIEYVIIDNFLLDYLLLKLTFLTKKGILYKNGLYYGAILGTVVSVLLPLITLPKIFLFLIKVLHGILMLLVSAKFNSFKQLIISFNMLLCLTFVFGGVIYGLLGLLQIEYSFIYGTASAFPLGVIILIAVIIYKACYRFFVALFEKKLIYPFIRECELYFEGQKIAFTGLIDSGNQIIYDRFNSVCIASSRLSKRLKQQGFLQSDELGNLQVRTIGGRGKIHLYRFDYIKIYFKDKVNIIKQPIIGIGDGEINLSEQYDLILSAEYALGE